ncbi:MAG: hypothetical protein ACPF9G_10360, partial [Paracoccaceae bacterium]
VYWRNHTAYILKRHQQKMLEKLKQLRLFPAVSTFTEAKEWIAIFEERSGWFETKKSLKTLLKNAR